MSTNLATRPEGRLSEWAHSPEARTQIAAAVGTAMDPDQFTTHMLVAFQAPEVRRCSVRSQATAFMECAALGLLPTLNQVKLIPYKDDIKAMPQWQGLKALMERHPDVLEVEPKLVHVSDSFQFSDGMVSHTFDPLDANRSITSEKDIRGGYAKITYRNGRPPKFHFVTVAHITKCQKCAQAQNVWRQWYEQMAVKTVLRDCYARRAVPVDPLVAERLERAFSIDDVNLGNIPCRPAEPPKMARLLSANAMPSDLVAPFVDAHDADHGEQQTEPAQDSQPEETPAQTDQERRIAALEACADVNAIDRFQKNVEAECNAGLCSQDEQMELLNRGLRMKADMAKKRK